MTMGVRAFLCRENNEEIYIKRNQDGDKDELMRLLQFGVNIISECVLFDFGYLSGLDVPLLPIKIDYCKDSQCKKGKAIPVTGHGGPQGCETSRLPHFLDNRLTDSGKVVSLTRRPPFTSRKIPGTHFC
jgi:hypothetical protein